jgi:hypothetical protein
LKNSENRYENANALNTIIKSKIKINIFLLISLNFNIQYYLDKIFTFGIEI